MISVITPIYNGEKFIESCLQTVINQNCASVEHLIVDGGSIDRTIEIVQRYAQQYPHIRWISEPDRGQSDAMNKGIALAKGEIIAMLNVDDYYEPNVLNRVEEIFKTLPEPSFVSGNCQIWDDEGQLLEVNRPEKLKLFDLVLGLNVNPYPCNPSAYFYHASLHQKVGGYEIADHYAMDLDFILRAVGAAHTVYVDEVWGNYRRIEGTKTVEDLRNGKTNQRVLDLLMRHRKQLSGSDQRRAAFLDRWRSLKIAIAIALEPLKLTRS